MMREIAWRVFAGEYNDSTKDVSEGGERSPTYVVTPLGAKINRLFLVGVVTDVENVGTEGGPMWRARLSDPTGTFHIYAGQYQPEASSTLSKLKPPVFAAIVGKTRTYKPENGTVYTSVRPEVVKQVDAHLRDFWILETCRSLKRRLEAVRETYKMESVTRESVAALGFSETLADGIALAVQHYGRVDLSRYEFMLAESLRYLLPEFQEYRAEELPVQEDQQVSAVKDDEKVESKVLAIIASLDKEGKGAPWDSILERASKEGLRKEELEDATNALLDRGKIYEPVLGRMRVIG